MPETPNVELSLVERFLRARRAIEASPDGALEALGEDFVDGIEAAADLVDALKARIGALEKALRQGREAIFVLRHARACSNEACQKPVNATSLAALDTINAVLSTLSPARVEEGETYAEWQQKRGRAADLIDWAINEYDGWMLDDHYDPRAPLDTIITRFRQYRDEAQPPPRKV